MTEELTTTREPEKSFHRLVFITRDDLLAARWWHEGMEATVAAPNRRAALKVLLGVGGVLGAGLLLRAGYRAFSDPGITLDALELQRKEGWSVGAQGKTIAIPGAVRTDSGGSMGWSSTLASLAEDLAPKDGTLDPFYVPTLFEVLKNPRGAGLKAVLSPMHTASMEEAEKSARALSGLFATEDEWKGTALVLDMPGPESVAAAVGVSKIFTPVFLFDNWPHPMGVVPSQLTLAAALYHRPDLLAIREERPAKAAPAFVLDSRRLSPYQDENDRFDNRYLARMPSPEALEGMGIRRLLYVTHIAQQNELDDLNDDFVAFRKKAIDVKMISLSDFGPAPASLAAGTPPTHHPYYYGGHPSGYLLFWSSYGWHSPMLIGRTMPSSLPRSVSGGGAFAPTPRPTIFSARTVGGRSGVGKQKPSGFGRVSYRSQSGTVGSSRRSGSIGRSRSGSFG